MMQQQQARLRDPMPRDDSAISLPSHCGASGNPKRASIPAFTFPTPGISKPPTTQARSSGHNASESEASLLSTFHTLKTRAEAVIQHRGILRASGTSLLQSASPQRWLGVPLIQRRARSYAAVDMILHALTLEHDGVVSSGGGHNKDGLLPDADVRLFADLRRCATRLLVRWGEAERLEAIGVVNFAWGVVGLMAGWIKEPDPKAWALKQQIVAHLRKAQCSEVEKTADTEGFKKMVMQLFGVVRENFDKIGTLYIADICQKWADVMEEKRREAKTEEEAQRTATPTKVHPSRPLLDFKFPSDSAAIEGSFHAKFKTTHYDPAPHDATPEADSEKKTAEEKGEAENGGAPPTSDPLGAPVADQRLRFAQDLAGESDEEQMHRVEMTCRGRTRRPKRTTSSNELRNGFLRSARGGPDKRDGEEGRRGGSDGGLR